MFDEAHNMGSEGFMKAAKQRKFYKKIGLSATPLRDWDEQGSNDFINNFFDSEIPVIQFTMKRRSMDDSYVNIIIFHISVF